MAGERRKAERQFQQSLPVKLVIHYVGAALIGSLVISGYLLISGLDATAPLGVLGSCITGLLALLGRVQPPQEAANTPTGTPDNPISTEATIINTPKDAVPTTESASYDAGTVSVDEIKYSDPVTMGVASHGMSDVPEIDGDDGEDDGTADELAAQAIAEQEKAVPA